MGGNIRGWEGGFVGVSQVTFFLVDGFTHMKKGANGLGEIVRGITDDHGDTRNSQEGRFTGAGGSPSLGQSKNSLYSNSPSQIPFRSSGLCRRHL